MTDSSHASLEERLERLERQNRRLKRVGGAVLAIVASVYLLGQAQPAANVIEAQAFVLVDQNGTKRAELSQFPGGNASLILYGHVGERVVELSGATPISPGLVLYDQLGERKVELTAGLGTFIGAHLRLEQGDGSFASLDPRMFTMKTQGGSSFGVSLLGGGAFLSLDDAGTAIWSAP